MKISTKINLDISTYLLIFALLNLKTSTMNNYKFKKLKEISSFVFGNHISDLANEGVKYLQVKNFDEYGSFLDNVEQFVAYDEIGKNGLLNEGDILFVGKGMKFFAYKYDRRIGEALASSIFYIIRVDQSEILPDYLVCLLNHPKSMTYFNGVSAGSSIPSIRKSELGDFEVHLPPLDVQAQIVEMYLLHKQELNMLSQLKEKKQIRFNQIINEILK